HLVGDLIWSSLALIAIVGAKTIVTFVFDLLGLACGFYLAWIGDAEDQTATKRPLEHNKRLPFRFRLGIDGAPTDPSEV
ncbi:LysE family translocator, partial [Rhizobium leguminosarum]